MAEPWQRLGCAAGEIEYFQITQTKRSRCVWIYLSLAEY